MIPFLMNTNVWKKNDKEGIANMLKNIIEKISTEFVVEAKSSPRLMEDMASMEKYMAESYGGRTFIELLQNADDALSKKIKIVCVGNALLFANDGRAFTEDDVIAISRSGASSKQRGVTIGYRGIGFKSTAYITNEIIIYSNDVYFTFSKRKCAHILGVNEDSVPTIRVPFIVEDRELEQSIAEEVAKLENEGFTTVFIFKNAKYDNIYDEILDINNGYFIFLNNIEYAIFDVMSCQKSFIINRVRSSNYDIVSIEGNVNEKWLNVYETKNDSTSIAFKLDNSNKVISCEEDEAVVHCYLPTLDKTGYYFKINGDFSTDPSRKHLVTDNITDNSIGTAARILFSVIKDSIDGYHNETFNNIFNILLSKSGFSKFAIEFNEQFRKIITDKEWLKLKNGTAVKTNIYKLFPEWIESSEKKMLRDLSPYIALKSLDSKVYDNFSQIDSFLQKYETEKYEISDFIEVLNDETFIREANSLTSGKILGNVIKTAKTKALISDIKINIDNCCLLLNEDKIARIANIKGNDNIEINKNVKEIINQIASNSDLEWFCSEYNQNIDSWETRKIETTMKPMFFTEQIKVNKKTTVSKWRTAEQQCVEIESGFGNKATDVSKKNMGYDVESKTTDGEMKYIEVKSLSNDGESFTMTNNEYTAAHQYGENYYLCLIIQKTDILKAIYIQNPLQKISLEKRVRQWEWYCEEYSGNQFVIDLK